MKIMRVIALCIGMLAPVCQPAVGATESPSFAQKRPQALMGTPPVNVNMAGGGTLPQGVLYTAVNASFSDKTHSERGGRGPDVFSQVWLLKVRYGLTHSVELNTAGSYVNLSRSPRPAGGSKHLEGIGDQTLGVSVAPWNIHQGDPFALSLTAGLMLPTAPEGKNHLPGSSAFGWRVSAAYGKFITSDLKFDTEAVWNGPFERGNQNVKRGEMYQWNTQFRYLFQSMDVGLESSLVHQQSGDKRVDGQSRNLRNGYTEWFVGPSMNFAVAPADIWIGVGMFFGLYQDVKSPGKTEDARFEFKIGKLW